MDKAVIFDFADSDLHSIEGTSERKPAIPEYLEKHYWWAYLNPKCVKFFEHQWIVNLILWGNFARLRDAALDEMGREISGRTLQIACVYGDFSLKLAQRLTPSARLDVVDVAPIQLENLRRKTRGVPNLHLDHQDASALTFADGEFDQTVLFFLLHELPAEVRKRAIREALRVVKPGGKLVIVDYHGPGPLHPLRYLMRPILMTLEPFALDLWRRALGDWVPEDMPLRALEKTTYFGGLYQKVVMTR
ncbi:MAG: rhodoquinone biosynthesis methyltransferase RquA [Pseudomonadota bacterium]|nr:rhodoquinone biosynthesis methyltransferase RquA [Pseudomonadota bacterium]